MDDEKQMLSDIGSDSEIDLFSAGVDDDKETDEEIIDIDEFIRRGGECGRYQIGVECLILLSVLPMVFPPMIFYYIGIDPMWKCNSHVDHAEGSFCANKSSNISFEHDNDARCSLRRDQWTYSYNERSTFATEFDLVCDRAWLDALNGSIVFIGWGVGSLVMGVLSDYFGRKRVMFPSFFMCLLSLLTHTFVRNIYQLLTARFFLGFFFASPALNTMVLLLEIVGPSKRGIAATGANLLWPIGAIVLTLKAYYLKSWRQLTLYCSAPYMLTVFLGILIPESVRWLNLKGKTNEAENILRRAANVNKRPISSLVKLKAADLNADNNNVKKSASYIDLFTSCRVLKIVLSQGYLWFHSGMTYYTLSWAFADLGGDRYVNFILSFIVEVPGTFLSMWAIQRFGRRKPTLVFCVSTAISCLGVACTPKEDNWKNLRVFFGLTGKFMISNVFSDIYVWSTEIYPTVVRTQGMGINIVTSRAGAATSPFIKVLDNFHPAAPFGLLTVSSIFASLCVLILPETLNKPTRETMDDLLRDTKVEVEMRVLYSVDDDEIDLNRITAMDNSSFQSEEERELETDRLIQVPVAAVLP